LLPTTNPVIPAQAGIQNRQEHRFRNGKEKQPA